ncbi:MAG TPA: DUF2490 domain-containing protein, partial [Flavisolibacter sp.]|nr:DUF2490 domain-containing protein [Flavisolibacter sp.]
MKKSSRRTGRYAMFLLILSPLMANAQRQRIGSNGLWACYFTNTRLGRRYSLVTEMEVHTKQWACRWAEQVLDVGVTNRLDEKWRVGTGAAWYRSAQYLDTFFFKNEWRLWQDAVFSLRSEKLVFSQRLRVEERWLQEMQDGKKLHSYEFVPRLRYRTEWQKPLGNGRITPVVGNEFMFNPTYWNSNRFLDQNRTWIGINVRISSATNIQGHYLKIFQWRANNTLEDQNVVRLNIVQQF